MITLNEWRQHFDELVNGFRINQKSIPINPYDLKNQNTENLENQLISLESSTETSYYITYIRINHFIDRLNLQDKCKEIPMIVYQTILLEMEKENINLINLTPQKVRQYLKYSHFLKYYEYVPHIINRLNGLPIQTITPRMKEEFRILFSKIQEPFEKHRPPNRLCFLPYNYVLHQFCQLLDYPDCLPDFPQLKSKEKMLYLNQIWEKICHELDWPPTGSLYEYREEQRKVWAATKLQNHWRRIIAQRKLIRMRIGQELEHYPGIGLKYHEGLQNWQNYQKYFH